MKKATIFRTACAETRRETGDTKPSGMTVTCKARKAAINRGGKCYTAF